MQNFLNALPSVVSGWIDAGCPCSGGGGKGKAILFNLRDVVEWLLKKKESEDVSEELERERLRKIRRENDEAEKLLAPVSLITDVIQKFASMAIPILENLPLIIKRNFPEITGDQITLVKKAVGRMPEYYC